MKPEDGGGDFERWLEAELKRTLGAANGPSPRAAQADYYAASRRGGRLKKRVATVTATGVALFAFGVGGGAVVATTTTGSANPAVWGQQLEAKVSDQVLSNERGTSATSTPHPTASAGKHLTEERRPGSSLGSASGHSSQSHENSGSPHEGSRQDRCDDLDGRHRPSPVHRH